MKGSERHGWEGLTEDTNRKDGISRPRRGLVELRESNCIQAGLATGSPWWNQKVEGDSKQEAII